MSEEFDDETTPSDLTSDLTEGLTEEAPAGAAHETAAATVPAGPRPAC